MPLFHGTRYGIMAGRAASQAGGGGGGGDPNFGSVVFLCSFDGTDGATTATEVKSHALTFVGNAQIDTAQSKFGGASLLLDGTGDRVTAADSVDWRLAAANSDPYTIEAWVRFNTIGTNRKLITQDGGAGSLGWELRTDATTSSELNFFTSSNLTSITATTSTSGAGLTTGTWYHIAVDHDSSGKVRIFVDGVMKGSATPADSVIGNTTAVLAIGDFSLGTGPAHNGWIEEVRITKGASRYSSDTSFTPPTAAFPTS